MAEIEFDEKILKRVTDKTGVYSSLRKLDKVMKESDKQSKFIMELRNQIMKTIEVAFREYARKHKGCTPKLENQEWQRFEKILKRYL